MEEQKMPLENQCSFTGIRPVMVESLTMQS